MSLLVPVLLPLVGTSPRVACDAVPPRITRCGLEIPSAPVVSAAARLPLPTAPALLHGTPPGASPPAILPHVSFQPLAFWRAISAPVNAFLLFACSVSAICLRKYSSPCATVLLRTASLLAHLPALSRMHLLAVVHHFVTTELRAEGWSGETFLPCPPVYVPSIESPVATNGPLQPLRI